MSRREIASLLLLTLAVAGVILGVLALVDRDRDALLRGLEAERLSQLDEAAAHFADDLDDIGEDLRFAAGLLARGGSPAEHEAELRTLIEVVGQYKGVAVFPGTEGAPPFIVWDRHVATSLKAPALLQALAHAAREAADRAPGSVVTSPPIALGAGGEHRVFATSVAAGPNRLAVAVVVDVAPLLSPFVLVARQTETKLLVLGAAGRPTTVSDALLARLASEPTRAPRAFAGALDRMARHERGCAAVPEDAASELDLGADPAVICFIPISVESGRPWAAATIASTRPIVAPLRKVALRTTLGAVLVIGFLVALAGYAVIAARRTAALHESRRAAAELAELHRRTQQILDRIPTGVLVLDRDLRVAALNEAVRTRAPTIFVGAELARAFPLAPAPVAHSLQAMVQHAVESRRPESRFGEHLAIFGQEGQFNLHVIPMEGGDPRAAALLVIEDVSQVRALESQLVRAEKLATIGVLAAGIAHEIGTPLGVVRGRAEYVLGKLGEAHPQAPGLRVIAEQIDQVTGTIGELLDFSRIHPAQARPTSLLATASAVEELLRIEATRRSVAMRVELPAALPEVWANPDQLRQVLVNLALNALDACSRGGAVVISAEARSGEALTTQVELTVADDGCGIPLAQQAQVFDPFFTTKKRGQGTGLGLTVVAQIVRNHGGEIRLESTEGAGTRVCVSWPVAPPHPESLHAGGV